MTYVNDHWTDEEQIHYTNLVISIFSENVKETVSKRIQKRKQFSNENVENNASTSDINIKITTYFVILDLNVN